MIAIALFFVGCAEAEDFSGRPAEGAEWWGEWLKLRDRAADAGVPMRDVDVRVAAEPCDRDWVWGCVSGGTVIVREELEPVDAVLVACHEYGHVVARETEGEVTSIAWEFACAEWYGTERARETTIEGYLFVLDGEAWSDCEYQRGLLAALHAFTERDTADALRAAAALEPSVVRLRAGEAERTPAEVLGELASAWLANGSTGE